MVFISVDNDPVSFLIVLIIVIVSNKGERPERGSPLLQNQNSLNFKR